MGYIFPGEKYNSVAAKACAVHQTNTTKADKRNFLPVNFFDQLFITHVLKYKLRIFVSFIF